MAIIKGLKKIVWGIPESIKPIENPPDGRMRLKLRNTEAGRVFFKTKDGIQHFVLLDNGETWGLMAQGINKRG